MAAQVVECEWPAFAAWLAAPIALGPHPLVDPYTPKHDQSFSPLSAIAPGKHGRINGGAASFLALEYDEGATPELLRDALERLARFDAVIYTSSSATPQRPRFRVVLRVTRPMVTDAEYRSCVDHVGIALGVPPAAESRQRTRIWYRPITGCATWVLAGGNAWDVDASLVACPPPPPRVKFDLDPNAFPRDERARLAWAALDSRRPEGSYAAALICRDYGLDEQGATHLVLAYGRAVWADVDDDAIAARVEHAYEYAREAPGSALTPTVATTPDLAARIAVSPATEPPAAAGMYPANDSGNADRLIALFGPNLRFAHGVGWLRWTGARWEGLPDGPWLEAEACAKLVRDEGIRLGGEAGKALEQWGRQSGNAGKIRGCIDVAAHRPGILVPADALDADLWALNTPGGVLDLRNGTMRPAAREDLCTKIAGVTPDPTMPTPRFAKFLLECMGGDAQLAEYLLRFMGYALTGDVREHALGIWHGPEGCNGKSTLLSLLESILGDYAGSTAPEVLLATQGGAHPTGLMDLRGRRLVTSNEAPEGRRWNESLVKQLTGGDEVKARAMRQDFVAFKPTWKLVLATNSRPLVREQGGAFWRRVQLVPWLVSFRGREDRGLARALADERPGILALLVRGCGHWLAGGLRPPPIVTAAVAEYRASQDTIGAFLNECVARAPSGHVARSELYRAYALWGSNTNEHVLPATVFYRVLDERGFRAVIVQGTRSYANLRLASAGF